MEILESIWGIVKIIFEIGLLSFIFYSILLFIRGTRAAPVLAGMTVFVLFLFLLSQVFDLEVMGWLLSKMWTVFMLAILIIFQPELRRAFAEVGSIRRGSSSGTTRRNKETISTLADTAYYLADRKIGALVAIERTIGMRIIAETGTLINTAVNGELLASIFYPNTPLHDGGVIIKDGKIVAAGCIFPLSQNDDIGKSLGTRHRAGVGMTEETDCISIIVSEETGAVSMAYMGHLIRDIDRDRLIRHLTNYLVKSKGHSKSSIRNSIDSLKTAVYEAEELEKIEGDEA